jgi:hypothetical protein
MGDGSRCYRQMSKTCEAIDAELAAWIGKQPLFFVATAPLSSDGHVNSSPKGGNSFRILGPGEVAYQDYTGSGAETAAHLNENGRIVIMFCAFDGAPRILRLHGRGEVIAPGHARFAEMASHFPPHPGTRAFIRVTVTRISTSCGHGVPLMELRGGRGLVEKWSISKGPEGLEEYRAAKNCSSIDGLRAFDPKR